MILGPVFWMELRTAARRARHYATRAFFVSLLFFVVLLVWDNFVSERRGYGSSMLLSLRAALAPHELAKLGRDIFAAYGLTQFLVLLFMAPLYSAGAVAGDRERRVLELLFTTDIRNIELVASKLLVRVIHIGMLAAAGFPVMALCLLLGGVAPADLAATVCLTVSVSFFVASLGLFISIGARRAYTAIIVTYLILLTLWLAVPVISSYLLFGGGATGTGWDVAGATLALNPVLALTTVVLERGLPGVLATSPWLCSIVYGVAGLVLIVTCMLVIRRLGLWASRERVPRRSRGRRWRPGRVRQVWANPVAWREVRTIAVHRRMRWARIMSLVFSFMISSIVWIGWIADWIDGRQAMAMDADSVSAVVACTASVAWVLMALQGAVCFSHEREHHTVDALLTTPLSGAQIVLGKLQGVVHNSLFALSFPIGFALVAWYLGVTTARAVALAIGVILIAGLLAACLGLFASVRLGSSGKASGVAAATVLAMCIAFPLIYEIFLRPRTYTPQPLAYASPATNLSWGIFDESARNNHRDYYRYVDRYESWQDRLPTSVKHLGFELFLSLMFVALSIHYIEAVGRVRQRHGAILLVSGQGQVREALPHDPNAVPASGRSM